MNKFLLAGLLALGSVSPAFAGEALSIDAGSTTNSVNNQQNSGSVVLNPSGGTQVNNNVNNAYSSTYSFGPGISCPTPSLALNTYGGTSSAWTDGFSGTGSGSFGASASFLMPLGGEIGTACQDLVQEIALQRQLDTKVNLIKVCANLAQSGITVDVKEFPEFAVCSAVTANGKTAVTTAPVFSPQQTAVPVIPVR